MSGGCVFCDQSWMRAAEIFIETPGAADARAYPARSVGGSGRSPAP